MKGLKSPIDPSMVFSTFDMDQLGKIHQLHWKGHLKISQVKLSQLNLGRVALSANGCYQKGLCINYDLMIKI